MTEEKKSVEEKQGQVEDKKEKADEQTISPSYSTNPIANAHTLDIDTRVSIPSEDDLIEMKEWADKNQQ